jgi:hypothetical protein
MMYRAAVASVLVLFGLSLTAQAQTYKIKVKQFPDPGKKTEDTTVEKTTGTVKSSAQGMVKEEKLSEITEKVLTVQTLENGGPQPKKLQKTYTKATHTKNDKQETLPYQGRTVIFELKGNSYQATAQGEPALPAGELKKLEDFADTAANMTRVMLPGKEVQVGDTWTIDTTKLVQSLGKTLPLDPAKSTAQGKLVKVYQKSNHQFGVLEFDLKMAITGFGPAKLNTPIPLTLKITLDVAIDGLSTQGTMNSTGTMQGKTDFNVGGQAITLEFDVHSSGHVTSSEEK